MIKHIDHLEIIAKELLKKEVIYQSDLVRLIGPRPFKAHSSYEAYFENKNENPLPKTEDVKTREVLDSNDPKSRDNGSDSGDATSNDAKTEEKANTPD